MAVWHDWQHPRWPAGTPGGLGGQFMGKGSEIGSLLGSTLKSEPKSTGLQSFVADAQTGQVAFVDGEALGVPEMQPLANEWATPGNRVYGTYNATAGTVTVSGDSPNVPPKVTGALQQALPPDTSVKTSPSSVKKLDDIWSEAPDGDEGQIKLRDKPPDTGEPSYVMVAADRVGFVDPDDPAAGDMSVGEIQQATPGATVFGLYSPALGELQLYGEGGELTGEQKKAVGEALPAGTKLQYNAKDVPGVIPEASSGSNALADKVKAAAPGDYPLQEGLPVGNGEATGFMYHPDTGEIASWPLAHNGEKPTHKTAEELGAVYAAKLYDDTLAIPGASHDEAKLQSLYGTLVDEVGFPIDTEVIGVPSPNGTGADSPTLGELLAEESPNAPETEFPVSLSEVGLVKNLGGSTGAALVEDDAGNRYVRKSGANAGHLREEYAVNRMYEAAGIAVPEEKMYGGDTAHPTKLSAYVEGTELGKYAGGKKKAAEDQVREGFAADALFGNWDVIGLDRDNILFDPEGIPYRIDNGGALRYRAMGQKKKPDQFGNQVTELGTMRDPAKTSGKVFGSLTDEEVAGQIDGLYAKKQAILDATPDDLKSTLDARLEYMKGWADQKKPSAPQDEGMDYGALGLDVVPGSGPQHVVIADGQAGFTPSAATFTAALDNIDKPDSDVADGKYNPDTGLLELYGHPLPVGTAIDDLQAKLPPDTKVHHYGPAGVFTDLGTLGGEEAHDPEDILPGTPPEPDKPEVYESGFPAGSYSHDAQNTPLYTQPKPGVKNKAVVTPEGEVLFFDKPGKSHNDILESLHGGYDKAKYAVRGNYDPDTDTLQLWNNKGGTLSDEQKDAIAKQLPSVGYLQLGTKKGEGESVPLSDFNLAPPAPEVWEGPGHPPGSSYGTVPDDSPKSLAPGTETFSEPDPTETNKMIVAPDGSLYYWTGPATPTQIAEGKVGWTPKDQKAYKGKYTPETGNYKFNAPKDPDAYDLDALKSKLEQSNPNAKTLQVGKETYDLNPEAQPSAPSTPTPQQAPTPTTTPAPSTVMPSEPPHSPSQGLGIVKPGSDPNFASDSYTGVLGDGDMTALYNRPAATGESGVVIMPDKSAYFLPPSVFPGDVRDKLGGAAYGMYNADTGEVAINGGKPPSGTKRNFKKVVPGAQTFEGTQLTEIPAGSSPPAMPPAPPGGQPHAVYKGTELFNGPVPGSTAKQKVVLSPSSPDDDYFWKGGPTHGQFPASAGHLTGIFDPKAADLDLSGPQTLDDEAVIDLIRSRHPQVQTATYNGKELEVWKPSEWKPNPEFDNLSLAAKHQRILGYMQPAWNGALTQAEKAAIKYYQDSSEPINRPLRFGKPMTASAAKKEKALNKGLNKMKTQEDMVVYRGMGTNQFQKVWADHGDDPEQMKGYVWHDPGYLGTTVKDNASNSYSEPTINFTNPGNPVYQKIRLPAGTPAFYAATSGKFGSEFELLLQKNTTWRVVDAWINEKGQKWLETELVGLGDKQV